MHQPQVSLRRMLIVIVPMAAALAIVARAATSWGPMNLVILAGFVLFAAAVFACVPNIPLRPFWAGLAIFGLIYAVVLAPTWSIATIGSFTISPFDPMFRSLAEDYYGPAPNYYITSFNAFYARPAWARAVEGFVAAAHALTALIFGIFGGCAMLILARARESRRWDRNALPELPLQDFMLPPLKIDRPLDSK